MTRRFADHSLPTTQVEAASSPAPVRHATNSSRPRPQELLYVIHATPPSSNSSSFDNLSYEPDFEHIQEETDAREREAKAKGEVNDQDPIATIVLVEDITKEKEKELAKKPEDEVKLLTPKRNKSAPKMTKTYFPSNGRQQQQQQERQQQQQQPQLQGYYTSSSHVSFKPSYEQQRQTPTYYPTSSVETVYSSSFSSPPPSDHCLRCCCPSEYDDDPGGATLFRVVIIASCLCLLHAAGLAVAVYILADRLTDPDMPEKPVKHICTSAIMCPFYYLFEVYRTSIYIASTIK